jgi:hypothetical protein
MVEFVSLLEDYLLPTGLPFDRSDLIAFVEANWRLMDDAPDPAVWAAAFAELVRERTEAAQTGPI